MSTNEDNLSVLRDSIEKATADGRFDEAALGLIDLAEQAPNDEERANAIRTAADLFEDKLGDPDQATMLRRVLAELYEDLWHDQPWRREVQALPAPVGVATRGGR